MAVSTSKGFNSATAHSAVEFHNGVDRVNNRVCDSFNSATAHSAVESLGGLV